LFYVIIFLKVEPSDSKTASTETEFYMK